MRLSKDGFRQRTKKLTFLRRRRSVFSLRAEPLKTSIPTTRTPPFSGEEGPFPVRLLPSHVLLGRALSHAVPAPKSLRATRIFDNDRQPRGLLYCPIRTAVKETSALSSALPARCNTNSLMSGGAHRVLRCRNARCRAAIPDSPYGTRGPWPHGSQSPTPGVDKRDSREKENRAKQRSFRTRSLRACNYSAGLMP